MAAEMDFSPPPPPPPEPARSPEPEILAPDHQSWKAEMMSALGESVSFGRFLTEPLEWGKWSAFEHNRYLEEAAHQSRPGSVAQKKAFFEAHYARKRKSEEDAADIEHEEAGGGTATAASASPGSSSSCMTNEPAAEKTSWCVGGTVVAAGPVDAHEELDAITDGVGSSCRVDEPHHKQDDVHGGESRDVLQAQEKKEVARQDPSADNSVAADADDKQPLKESSIVNQGSAESVKRRRLPSLLQKPAKFNSPSSSKGPASSAKRRSRLHSAKENSSPPNDESNQQATSSVPRNRSIPESFQKSENIARCETGNAASSSKNLGSTIAARISQLESATGPVNHIHFAVSQVKPPREVFSKDVPEIAWRTTQLEEQRSSHVTKVNEKLFGFTSQSMHQKANIHKDQGKPQNESFKARPLPNFCRKNKQAKDSSHQSAQDINSHARPTSKEASKDKPICCFPLRRLG